MEGPASSTAVNTADAPDPEALLAQLRALQGQVAAITYPNRADIVGLELDTIDRALRRLLRDLGDRDSVDV